MNSQYIVYLTDSGFWPHRLTVEETTEMMLKPRRLPDALPPDNIPFVVVFAHNQRGAMFQAGRDWKEHSTNRETWEAAEA